MLKLLSVDEWGVDWTGWAEIRKSGQTALRFPIAKYIVWC